MALKGVPSLDVSRPSGKLLQKGPALKTMTNGTEYTVKILGSRGIPARHGGFETFAEQLALYLSERNWKVEVYCQDSKGSSPGNEAWNGISLIRIPVRQGGPLGTIVFDWKSTVHAARGRGPILTLGYNTAVFSLIYRIRGIRNIFNMDGLEWKRSKWSMPVRAWFYANERLACWLGDHLVADNPWVQKRLSGFVPQSKISMIPYCADAVEGADPAIPDRYGLRPDGYALVIARPEPENSILEIVSAFSRKNRGLKLAVLGAYSPETNSYHRKVVQAAGEEVAFLGAVYDKQTVSALRFFSKLYIHGHSVGGTNPSLVEAMGAGSAILARDNDFNRWVAGPDAHFFRDADDCASELDVLFNDPSAIEKLKMSSTRRHSELFTNEKVLSLYLKLLCDWQKA